MDFPSAKTDAFKYQKRARSWSLDIMHEDIAAMKDFGTLSEPHPSSVIRCPSTHHQRRNLLHQLDPNVFLALHVQSFPHPTRTVQWHASTSLSSSKLREQPYFHAPISARFSNRISDSSGFRDATPSTQRHHIFESDLLLFRLVCC